VANLAAIHVKQVTLQAKDMKLIHNMQNIMIGFAWVGNPKKPLVSYSNLYDDL